MTPFDELAAELREYLTPDTQQLADLCDEVARYLAVLWRLLRALSRILARYHD
jgi:hypothetical protein